MTRHLSALVAAAAFAAAASPALGQSAPPPVVAMPPAGAAVALPAGQGGYQGAPVAYPAGPYAQGSWVWHGDGGSAAGAAYSQGPYAQGSWVWHGEGGDAAGVTYPQGSYAHGRWIWSGEGGSAQAYGYPAGAGSCGCPSYGYPVTWMQVPVQTSYAYSPAVRHDRQVVEQHTVNDVVVESKTVPVRPATKYVKTPETKVTKVRRTK